MKKLYLTLAAALLGVSAMSAKELTFYVGNTAIQPGEEVEYKLQPSDYTDENGYIEYQIEPNVKIYADFVGQVEIKVKSDNNDVQVCPNGNCYPGDDINFTLTLQSKQTLNLAYHLMGDADNTEAIPTVTSKFTAQYVGDESTKKEFTLIVNPTAGVASIVAEGNSFRAVNGGIEYSLDAPATAALYSITGKKVLSANLNGSGTLSTANLPAGIYIYTLNGKSGKIVLK